MRIARPTYQSYILEKRRKGEKPLAQKEWEARVLGKAPAKAEPHEEEDGRSYVSKVFDVLKRLKNVPKDIADAVKAAPAEVHKIIVDVEHREKAFVKILEHAKKTPGKLIEKAWKAAKTEIHEARIAGKAVVKLAKGGKLSKKEKKAIYGTGLYMSGMIMAAVPPGTALMAAGALGRSFAVHVAAGATASFLNESFAHFEAIATIAEATHLFKELVASREETLRRAILAADEAGDEDGLARATMAYMAAHVTKQLGKGISQKDMDGILQGSEPAREKESSLLRRRTIHLAHADLLLRAHLLPLLADKV